MNIEITSGLRYRFVWTKLYYVGPAINTCYEIQTNDGLNAYSFTFEIQLKILKLN